MKVQYYTKVKICDRINFMMYLTTISSQRQITLPKALLDQANMSTSDRVVLTIGGKGIQLEPVKDVLDFAGSVPAQSKTTVLEARKKFEKQFSRV